MAHTQAEAEARAAAIYQTAEMLIQRRVAETLEKVLKEEIGITGWRLNDWSLTIGLRQVNGQGEFCGMSTRRIQSRDEDDWVPGMPM